MKRKNLLISGFVFLILVLSISCEKDEIVGPLQKENTIFGNKDLMNLEVKNIGKIHNEILEEFDKEHDLLSEERLNAEEFVALTTKSINKVFRTRDIPCEVSPRDIRFIISKFVEIKQAGAYNFFSDSDQDLSNVKPLFEYFEKNMGLNERTSEKCIKIVNIAERNDQSNMIFQTPVRNINYDANAQSFSEILNYSKDYWKNKYRGNELDFQKEDDDTTSTISGKFYADAAGGIIGALFGGGLASAIMAPAASIAFQCQIDHPEYWLPPTHTGRW